MVCLPEIVDYELRRAFLLERLTASIRALDQLPEEGCEFVPLTSATMRRAAELWAELRRVGQPTAADHALDADCILAAQAQLRGEADARPVVVATTNAKHLSRMVDAKLWSEVT
jgi:predicted nucleic acid-binding protein